jgi:hypothetical protein
LDGFSTDFSGFAGAGAVDWHRAVTPEQRNKARNVNLIGLPSRQVNIDSLTATSLFWLAYPILLSVEQENALNQI